MAYVDAAGGSALESGEYATAARTLKQMLAWTAVDPGALETNRCVAYTVTRQLPAARVACDAAVREAQSERSGFLAATVWNTGAYDTALAYSNRAVLEWLSGDKAAAERDLVRARALAPGADFVAHNLSAVRERTGAATSVHMASLMAQLRPAQR
jgi:hypothetical protein